MEKRQGTAALQNLAEMRTGLQYRGGVERGTRVNGFPGAAVGVEATAEVKGVQSSRCDLEIRLESAGGYEGGAAREWLMSG